MSRRKKHAPAKPTAFAEDARKNLPNDARTLIASVQNDITIPFYSGVLRNSDETLLNQGGGKGLAIYDEIKRDGLAGALLEKRKNTLTSRDWEVEAAGEKPIDIEAAKFITEMLDILSFDQICKDLLEATLKGFAVAEIVWARNGNRILPIKIKCHDERRFVFDRDWQPRLLTWAALAEGEPLPARKFIVHRVGVKGNNPYGLGLGSSLFWPVLFKREGITFWLHFLEKFAGPTVVGKTPYGMLSDEQNKLMNTLLTVRTSSAITVPIGTDIEFLEASRSGSVSYEAFLAYWDKQISIRITGETLTTQVSDGGGNRALGEVHQEQLDVLADSDGDLQAETLRDTLCQWIVEYNFPGAAVPTIRRTRPENAKAAAETRKTKAEAAKAVNEAILLIVKQAAQFEDDSVAHEYITSFELTDGLSEKTIAALVAARFAFVGPTEAADPFTTADPASDPTSFAGNRLKKKA
ncbi:DUF935 domain-containing protein [Pseudorhodobacter sp.]|uniref:DUF935 domain-containing protein n=1 Tax=Pseudorhodobacter sp. TaxID=1934400 RepID=UPI0026491131|nr:DUF935 family protein [Pseudorhodobacter sp.]MDN5785736.1 DUF935 domain-containing protein [Pseudorhodobacter sp.]